METLKLYEKAVLKLLLKVVYSDKEISEIQEESEFVSYEYTKWGYFLIIRHEILPVERHVCQEPIVIGEANGGHLWFCPISSRQGAHVGIISLG